MEFIDANRDEVVEGVRLGVEPIVTVLRDAGVAVAPSSYYAHKTRSASKRARRDEELVVELARIWVDNYSVYGVRNSTRPPTGPAWRSAGTSADG